MYAYSLKKNDDLQNESAIQVVDSDVNQPNELMFREVPRRLRRRWRRGRMGRPQVQGDQGPSMIHCGG
jgi:hypothetical protein